MKRNQTGSGSSLLHLYQYWCGGLGAVYYTCTSIGVVALEQSTTPVPVLVWWPWSSLLHLYQYWCGGLDLA